MVTIDPKVENIGVYLKLISSAANIRGGVFYHLKVKEKPE